MTFEADYSVLLSQSKFAIKQNEIDLQPEELLSNIYLKLFSSPDYVYDYFSFEKEIFITCKYFNHNQPYFIPYTDKWKACKKHIDFKSQQTCRVCKVTKNATCFQVKENKLGKKVQRKVCKDCYTDWRKKYNAENKEKARLQKIRKKILNPELVKSQKRNHNKKRCKEITDDYVKLVLYRIYSKEYMKNNPEVIEQTRLRIIAKRQKRIVKKIKSYNEEKEQCLI